MISSFGHSIASAQHQWDVAQRSPKLSSISDREKSERL
jgi:hypothetical protein